jgi:hypothetical protein
MRHDLLARGESRPASGASFLARRSPGEATVRPLKVGPALLACLALLAAPRTARADEHVTSELRRTSNGRTYPVQPSEVWVSPDKTYLRDGGVVVVLRYDLQKKWTIVASRRKYLEEPLNSPPPGRKAAAPSRIQEYGFDYEPVYEWTVNETPERTSLNGIPCRKILVRGDAEYAEKTLEMWVATEVPVDAKAYYERAVVPFLDESWLKIYQGLADLRKGIVVRSLITSDPAAASPSVTEIVVTKMERAQPPGGIYEVPGDFRKVSTRSELHAR